MFWALVAPLFRGLIHLSDVYAHHGMFQETMYYAEQAHTLVKEVGSDFYVAMASAYLGSRWLRAGVLDKGSEFLMESKKLSGADNKSRNAAILAYHLGSMHGLLGDHSAETAAYDDAELTIGRLMEPNFISQLDQLVGPAESLELEMEMSKLSLSKRKLSGKTKVAARPNGTTKRKATVRAKSPPAEINTLIGLEYPQISSLKATVIRQKAATLASGRDYAEAQGLLSEMTAYSTTQIDLVEQGLAMARNLLLQSMDQMNSDPVYSVLQESTISFPSITGQSKTDERTNERVSITKVSSSLKVPAAKRTRNNNCSKSPDPGSFIEKLCQAQEHLAEIYPIALSCSTCLRTSLHIISPQ